MYGIPGIIKLLRRKYQVQISETVIGFVRRNGFFLRLDCKVAFKIMSENIKTGMVANN